MPIIVTLDKERELRYTMHAALRLDREYGINLLDPTTYQSFSPKQAVALLWAGQLHTKNPLTLAQVEQYVPLQTEAYVALMLQVSEALGAALGNEPNKVH